MLTHSGSVGLFANGLYAVVSYGRIRVSKDGINWAQSALEASSVLLYANGVWLCSAAIYGDTQRLPQRYSSVLLYSSVEELDLQ